MSITHWYRLRWCRRTRWDSRTTPGRRSWSRTSRRGGSVTDGGIKSPSQPPRRLYRSSWIKPRPPWICPGPNSPSTNKYHSKTEVGFQMTFSHCYLVNISMRTAPSIQILTTNDLLGNLWDYYDLIHAVSSPLDPAAFLFLKWVANCYLSRNRTAVWQGISFLAIYCWLWMTPNKD